jgi:uncharacterized protein
MSELSKIPYLGLGIGMRSDIADETFAHSKKIDAVELISENFFSYKHPPTHRFRERAEATFRAVVPHGINLSIGSSLPFDADFLREIKWLTNILGASYYSDHFCISRHDELHDTGHLTPLWYTKEMLEHVSRRVDEVQQYVGKPLVLENITAPFTIPEADYEEPEFITKVCERTGCGLLLDVTNVFINAYNAKKDPLSLLKQYPMDKVVHIHLAGGTIDEHGVYHDSHSARVHDEVWPLLEYTAAHADIKVLIIERDDDFEEDFNALVLDDLSRARSIIESARTARLNL